MIEETKALLGILQQQKRDCEMQYVANINAIDGSIQVLTKLIAAAEAQAADEHMKGL